jgi:hypothetical protein
MSAAQGDFMSEQKYFPWEPFQRWLHEGIVAGWILNRIMIESSGEKKSFYPASLAKEQREFLNGVKLWAEKAGKASFCEAVSLVLQSDGGLPKLNEQQAQVLFEAVSEYGTASSRFLQVLPALKEYVVSLPDVDAALKQEFDAIWRSIGPSLSLDRTGLQDA